MDFANHSKYERIIERYTGLATDIEDNGYNRRNILFEVGSQGQLTPDNTSKLSMVHKLTQK